MEDPSLDPVLAQVIVDENAINRYITQMIMVDKIYSLRQFLAGSQRFRSFSG